MGSLLGFGLGVSSSRLARGWWSRGDVLAVLGAGGQVLQTDLSGLLYGEALRRWAHRVPGRRSDRAFPAGLQGLRWLARKRAYTIFLFRRLLDPETGFGRSRLSLPGGGLGRAVGGQVTVVLIGDLEVWRGFLVLSVRRAPPVAIQAIPSQGVGNIRVARFLYSLGPCIAIVLTSDR